MHRVMGVLQKIGRGLLAQEIAAGLHEILRDGLDL